LYFANGSPSAFTHIESVFFASNILLYF